jgi:hypothetical protein
VASSEKPTAPALAPEVEATIETPQLPFSERDPFRRLEIEGEPEPCERGLCSVPISDLSLVGTVTDLGDPLAMVRDRDEIGYIVRNGNSIGRERATVVRIGATSIVAVQKKVVGNRRIPIRFDLSMPVVAVREPLDLSQPGE